ncbi:MAG: thioredoxin domain-containing protein [Sumerlaeia bacterium]
MTSSAENTSNHQRPEIPSPEILAKLPKDGGALWNRLVFEQSPYLLQHAANPVDWYPWGEEAFARAKAENKPVFLSIGYSTCHWCHVMEHESFESDEIAALMNEAFINIKVDREERPDIDAVYMQVTLAMNGHGGWPMSVVMTPEKEPFFTGTYFPPQSEGYNRVGMKELIPAIRDGWAKERDKIVDTARDITNQVAQAQVGTGGEAVTEETLRSAFQYFDENFDDVYGGMAGARNKFPSPHQYILLLRIGQRIGQAPRALEMVEKTLQQMRAGGIFDHVGYGFHRYSTDSEWLLPHFEKMLYDQALIALLALETYQATGDEQYAQIAREIFTYVLRDMTSPEGGFYCAEDADSEGEEGKFYTWSVAELFPVLGAEDAPLYAKAYGMREVGNFRDEATGKLTGLNIPHLNKPLKQRADELKIPLTELESRLEVCRQKLFLARGERIHPYKDDKILTDWNGLMIAALARGGRVLGNQNYTDASVKASSFALSSLRKPDGLLHKRFRRGQAGLPAHLDDYAFLVWGLMETYECSFQPEFLTAAIELTETMHQRFQDPTGGYFLTTTDHLTGADEMVFRTREAYDGAAPSGNSVAFMNLARLYKITGDQKYSQRAQEGLTSFGKSIQRGAAGYSYMLMAFDQLTSSDSQEIVLAGDEPDAFLKVLEKNYLPRAVLLHRPNGEDSPIAKIADFTQYQAPIDGKPTAYLCRNRACQLPAKSPQELAAQLEKLSVK